MTKKTKIEHPSFALQEIYEGMIKEHPEILDLLEEHVGHSAWDCETLIGNPGVGDKFETLQKEEQDRLQNIVDSIRIHLAVLEETNLNNNKTLEQLRQQMKNAREESHRDVEKNALCLQELKQDISDIKSTMSGIQATQKILWVIISTLLLGFIGQIIGLGIWLVQRIITSGIFN